MRHRGRLQPEIRLGHSERPEVERRRCGATLGPPPLLTVWLGPVGGGLLLGYLLNQVSVLLRRCSTKTSSSAQAEKKHCAADNTHTVVFCAKG